MLEKVEGCMASGRGEKKSVLVVGGWLMSVSSDE